MWELTNQEISEGILNEASHHDNIIVKGQDELMQKTLSFKPDSN